MTWKSYVAMSGAGLVATYLFSTPGPVVPERTAVVRPEVARPAPPAVDIQEEAARLTVRVPRATEYQEPSRNPFRYRGRPEPAAPPTSNPVAPEAPAAAPVELPPAPPLVRVSGILTNVVDGVRHRSAVLMTASGTIDVREGDVVGGIYRVRRIDEDAVELVESDGTSRRISLRP